MSRNTASLDGGTISPIQLLDVCTVVQTRRSAITALKRATGRTSRNRAASVRFVAAFRRLTRSMAAIGRSRLSREPKRA